MDKLLVIIGPTAVGKTAISIELAKKLSGEVISGDSMQVYKDLDIGTAKIKPEEAAGIPHHLIDIRQPDEAFSVADFQQLARCKIKEINSRGKLPILVGGTGLYVQAVLDEYEFGPTMENQEFRRNMHKIAAEKGPDYLHQQLQKIDPLSAKKLHPNDLRRVIRAMEYYHTTGKRISSNNEGYKREQSKRYESAIIGLTMERQLLYQRIESRVDKMMEEGFLEEVKGLLSRGYGADLPSMQGLGYKQLVGYLTGETDLATAISLIKRDTRHFAKRQLTWFRRDPRIEWFQVDQYDNQQAIVQEILSYLGRSLLNSVEY